MDNINNLDDYSFDGFGSVSLSEEDIAKLETQQPDITSVEPAVTEPVVAPAPDAVTTDPVTPPEPQLDPFAPPGPIEPLEPKEEPPVEPQTDPTTVDTDLEIIGATTRTLSDQGIILLGDDEEIKTWDELVDKMKDIPSRAVNTVINNAPDILKDTIAFGYNKGNNLTKEELRGFLNTYLGDLDNQEIKTDFSSKDEARAYLEQVYNKQGLPEIGVKGMLDTLEDQDEDGKALVDQAKAVAEKQKATLKSPQLMQESLIDKQKRVRQQTAFASEIKEELSGTGWKPTKISEVGRVLATGKTRDVFSEAAKSPKAVVQMAMLSTFYNAEKGEFDFEEFTKQAYSKQVGAVKDNIERNHFSSVKQTSGTTKVLPNPDKPAHEAYKPQISYDFE